MEVKKINKEIVKVICKNQQDLTTTFLRFQEHYESANPQFKDGVFTLGQFREWYSKEYGAFTYYKDWSGMNIPSYVFNAFRQGLFDPLTAKEQKLLDLFKDRNDNFYVIGAYKGGEDSIDHEVCHGLFYTNPKYKKEALTALRKFDLSNLKKWLLSIGYCEEVLEDECHAYVSADYDWLKEEKDIETPKKLHDKLRAIKNRYFKEAK